MNNEVAKQLKYTTTETINGEDDFNRLKNASITCFCARRCILTLHIKIMLPELPEVYTLLRVCM